MTTAVGTGLTRHSIPILQDAPSPPQPAQHANSALTHPPVIPGHALLRAPSVARAGGTVAAPALATRETCEVHVTCETPSGRRDIAVDVLVPGGEDAIPRDFAHAFAQVAPATVFISAKTGDSRWSGTGVIIRPSQLDPLIAERLNLKPTDRIVLTNHHVATHSNQPAERLRITIPGANDMDADPSNDSRHYAAEVLRSPHNNAHVMDEALDIAALIIRTDDTLPTAQLTDPDYTKKLRPGQPVFSLGFPAALPRITATLGHISQPQQITRVEPNTVIHHTATINGGNSGGPLVTHDGIVVGLNTYTLRGRDDMNFAEHLPAQLTILRTIFHTGEMARGELGLRFGEFHPMDDPTFPQRNGVMVRSLIPDSAAAEHFEEGDVIVEMHDMATGERTRPNIWNDKLTAITDRWVQQRGINRHVEITYYRKMDIVGITTWIKKTATIKVERLTDDG